MTPVCHVLSMHKVLLLTLVFAPDGVSTAVLMTELTQELQTLGHNVTVLTTTPHYNVEPEARVRQPLQPYWGRWLQRSEIDGITVYHASIPVKGDRVGARLLDYLRFHAISTAAGLFAVGKFDVMLVPSPPLTIGISAWLLRLLRGAPFIYNVQEIWPELPVRLGVIKNPLMIRLFQWMEHFVYDRADAISVISEYFRQNLEAKGVPTAKMHVIPNFVDTTFVSPQVKDNEFARRHQLQGKFVVSYAGNIGLTQDLESVLAAASALQELENLHFLIVGDGARRGWLENEIQHKNLNNITLLPYQSRSTVPLIYASSDLCVVPLKKGTAQDTFPSKVYTIMSSGRSVLAATDPESELAWVVQQSGSGWTVAPEDPDALAEIIRTAMANPAICSDQGKRGRAYVTEHHSPESVAHRYDELIRSLTRKSAK